jgi:hypothetical protein
MVRTFKFYYTKNGVVAIYNGCVGRGCNVVEALERAVKGYETKTKRQSNRF